LIQNILKSGTGFVLNWDPENHELGDFRFVRARCDAHHSFNG